MNLSNPWLGPLQRSYQTIRSRLIDKLLELKHPNGSPLITDVSEGNILVLILSMFSGISEVIHFYIDNMARETFLPTARRYDSLVKQGALVDYHPKLATAAQCDIIFIRDLVDAKNPLTIPAGIQVTDSQGNVWENIMAVTMPAEVSQVTAQFIQHELLNGQINGTVIKDTDGSLRMYLVTPSKGYYEQSSTTQVKVAGVAYSEVETFAYSKPTDHHFIVVSDESGKTYLQFGDGVYGAKPAEGDFVEGNIYVTMGADGNIEPKSISGTYQGCPYSNLSGGGGSNYEDFDTLKRRIPLSVKTLGVAITKQDYVDLALQYPGVSQAALDTTNGRLFNLYISAVGGGHPTGLASDVKDYLLQHSPMNTWLNVIFAGQSKMILKVSVTGKPSYKYDDIRNSIISALAKAYPLDGPIGGKVRLSDIYALIDNQDPVDYLRITQFYIMPWPKIIFGNVPLLVNDFLIKNTNGEAKYLVEFTGNNTFKVLPYDNVTTFSSNNETSYQSFDGTIGQTLTINYPEGFKFNINLNGKGFQEGFKYEFTVGDTNLDYDQTGFNIPIFDVNNLTLDITETT